MEVCGLVTGIVCFWKVGRGREECAPLRGTLWSCCRQVASHTQVEYEAELAEDAGIKVGLLTTRSQKQHN